MEFNSNSKCFFCECNLHENSSKEHVIPNAIGGKLKVANFICKECNQKYGEKLDSEVADQLHSLCSLFLIKRERGKVPDYITSTPEDKTKSIVLHGDGKYSIYDKKRVEELSKTETEKKYKISAKNRKEADRIIRKMRSKCQHKGKKLTFKIEEKIVDKNFTIQNKFQVGGKRFNESILKTVLAYACYLKLKMTDFNKQKDYLINENNTKQEAEFGFFYDKNRDFVQNRPNDRIFHCVSIMGCPTEKLLIAYVEYFSCTRVIVLLSDQYNGSLYTQTYAIDPCSGKKLDI